MLGLSIAERTNALRTQNHGIGMCVESGITAMPGSSDALDALAVRVDVFAIGTRL